MFIDASHNYIAYTGRWYLDGHTAITTTAGAYLDVGFEGETLSFRFQVSDPAIDTAHLYLSVDGGAQVESAVTPFVRVSATQGKHRVRLTFKSSSEFYDRWVNPMSKVALLGMEAENFYPLPRDTRPIIEFIGDSITEGVEVDPTPYPIYDHFCKERIYQDDSTATYAYLTAEKMGMRPYVMGYGAVGVTKGGCGKVPSAREAYPFCFAGAAVAPYEPNIIVLNHGTNDGDASEEQFVTCYYQMLDLLSNTHPSAEIVALSPFFGKRDALVERAVSEYNQTHDKQVHCILTTGWIPPQPIHPSRAGHKTVAEQLAKRLKELLSI